jgi:predicted DNA-binding transcriptional regulator AlpA
MHRLLTAHQVADILGITRRAFSARRAALEARHGFPPRVPGLPDRWSAAAIDAWIAGQSGATLATPATAEATLIARAQRLTA